MDKAELQVLVVDDYQAMRRMLADILRYAGIKNISHAEDGAVAWNRIRQQNPSFDLVFLDWDMPNMTGIELLQQLRAEEQYKDMPVIMITAEADVEHVKEAIEVGVTDYIVKPYKPQTVISKIQSVMKVKLA